ncbi:hypothetical protein [Chimaeribacter arupi]|uniref:hypothetical protein n=1 Tax=Chimaeribacter arupi TaxID=2060066 RepID=UPI001F4E3967|nr:hypothetical protein [Chimaeribacter arupi]
MPNLFILYVASPPASSAFYEKLFERAPEVVLPTWAAFAFDNGLHLGLWSTHARDFASGGPGPATELSIMVKDRQEVEALYARWPGWGWRLNSRRMMRYLAEPLWRVTRTATGCGSVYRISAPQACGLYVTD